MARFRLSFVPSIILLAFMLFGLLVARPLVLGQETVQPTLSDEQIIATFMADITRGVPSSTPTHTPTITSTFTSTPRLSMTDLYQTALARVSAAAPTPTATLVCRLSDFENAIPDAFTYEIVVQPNEFHLWSSGNVYVYYQGDLVIALSGSSDIDPGRGNIVVLLPVNGEETTYELRNITPYSNYHAWYTNCADTMQIGWAENQADIMMQEGNCNLDTGCIHVEIAIVEGSEFNQYRYEPITE